MHTQVIPVGALASDEERAHATARAAKSLCSGELIIFPTETVYGIGADAFQRDAANKIFSAKGRPADNPLIVHISNPEMLARVARAVSPMEQELMDAFWPGPLTLILPKTEAVPFEVTGGLDTVAVRMPQHPIARALIETADVPIAAPSANRSGSPSGTHLAALLEDFKGVVPIVLDAGPAEGGIESTVVKVEADALYILRPGSVTAEMLQEILPLPVRVPDARRAQSSPGTRYPHYAPRAPVFIAKDTNELKSLRDAYGAQGKRVAVLGFEEDTDAFSDVFFFSMGSKNNLSTYAKLLYRHLREADQAGADVILVPAVTEIGLGAALMDRIRKAASA